MDGLEDAGYGEDAGPAVVYEIEGTEVGESGANALEQGTEAAAAPPAPAAPPPGPHAAEINDLRRQLADIGGQLTPWLAHLQQQRQQATERPPFAIEELDTDPNKKPSDIARLLDWRLNQATQQLQAQARYIAQTTLSEQEARGRFNAAEMGEGLDYDSMVARYVAPLVAQNPAVDQLVHMAAPSNPAEARMIFAAVVHIINENGGDVVKGLKAALNSTKAFKQGATATQASIRKAQTAASARVLPAASAAPVTRKRLETADDVWNMSPSAFRRYFDNAGR